MKIILLFLIAATLLPAAEKLNIVMIISDDHGGSDAGCYGNAHVSTPHLDQLAAEGMRFTHAFAATTLCSPSRAVIATGLMPFRNGGHVFGGNVHDGTKTIAHHFRDLGYQTASFGKFSVRPGKAFPFEVVNSKWSPSDRDVGLTQQVDDFLKERKTDRPLFLKINTSDTHMPWVKNKKFDPASLTIPPHLVDTKETREALADYYSSVESLDATIGRITTILDKNGYRDNTLLIYTSDHGPAFAFAKWCLYDEGLRVPLIVRWPGSVRSKSSSEAMVSLADLMPTVIEAAGGTAPTDIDGKSFADVLNGKKNEHHEFIFSSHTGNNSQYAVWKANWSPARAIRTRTHKYILNLNPDYEFMCHINGRAPNRKSEARQTYWDSWVELVKTDPAVRTRVDQFQHRPEHELYDLTKDPFERKNIADDPESAGIIKSLQTQLAAWREKQGDDVPVYADKKYVAPMPKK